MPTYSIQGPDGKTYSIDGPNGATREQVIAKIQERQQSSAPQSFVSQVTEPLRKLPGDIAEKFGEGREMARSGIQDIESGGVGNIVKGAGKAALGGFEEAVSPLTGATRAFGSRPVERAIPGEAGKFIGGAVETAESFGLPSTASKALEAGSKALPSLSKSVKMLMDEGVRLTPGHMGGRATKVAEDALSSTPIAGSFIDSAQRRALEDFNRATINKSIRAAGGKEASQDVKAGTDLIAYAQKEHGRMWDAVERQLQWRLDQPLAQSLQQSVVRDIRMTQADQSRLDEIVGDVMNRVSSPQATAATFKGLRSDLSRIANDYITRDTNSEQVLGHKIRDVVDEMWGSLERQNPQHAQKLQDLRLGWAMYQRAEGAAFRRKTAGSVFTPSDLLQDIGKNTTRSAFTRGDGLLREWAQAGQEVLPQTINRSGTAERSMWGALGGAAILEPEAAKLLAGGLVAGAAGFSRPSVEAVNALVKGGPRFGRSAMDVLSRGGPATGAADILSQEQQNAPP